MFRLVNSVVAAVSRRIGRSLAPMWLVMCGMIGLVVIATIGH